MGDPGFLKALDDLRALHLSKGHDYANEADPLLNYVNSAHDARVEPWRSAFLRLSEKYHRFCNLLDKNEEPQHETLDDTLMDMAALALIVRSLRARTKPSLGMTNPKLGLPEKIPTTTVAMCYLPASSPPFVIKRACCAQGDGDDGA